MADKELLNAISTMLEQTLKPIKTDIADMKSDIASLKTGNASMKSDIANLKSDNVNMKSDIAYIMKNMVTKEDLRRSENMILAQVDFVQERTNEKFRNLQFH